MTVQKTAEVPHMQFIDEFAPIPVGNLQSGVYGGDEGLLRVVPELSAMRALDDEEFFVSHSDCRVSSHKVIEL